MFSKALEYQIPIEDQTYRQLEQTQPKYCRTRGFDTYSAFAQCGSRNMYNAYWEIRHNRNQESWFKAITHLISVISEDTHNYPTISATFMRCTQTAIDACNNNLRQLLINTDAPINARHRQYYNVHIHTTAENPIMHVVYVNSGMSLLKNMIEQNNIPRETILENIALSYARSNTRANRGNINCIIVKDIFESCEEYTTNYTIFIDHIDPIILETLVLLQAHISSSITMAGDDFINECITKLEDILAQPETLNADTLDLIPNYFAMVLTKIFRITLNIATSNQNNIDPIQLNQKEEDFANEIKPLLDIFYKVLYLLQQTASESDFVNNLCTAYENLFTGADKRTIERNQAAIKECYARLEQLQLETLTAQRRLNAAQKCTPESIQQMFDTLTVFKNIEITNKTATELQLHIVSPLTFFDSEDAKTVLKNTNSDVNRAITQYCMEHSLNKTVMRSVFYDIFVRRMYTIQTFTDFKITINTSASSGSDNIISITPINRNNVYSNEIIRQPHIMGYSCWSQAHTAFMKAFTEQNYENAFAQLAGATQNLTMSDAIVTRNFVLKLLEYWTLPTLLTNEIEPKPINIQAIYHEKMQNAATEIVDPAEYPEF